MNRLGRQAPGCKMQNRDKLIGLMEQAASAVNLVNPAEDVPLILDFISETGEHIESCEAGLLALESKPGDSETLNQIFRAFHTIKGMAGFLNLTETGSLAHSAENLLDLARKGCTSLFSQQQQMLERLT